MAMTFEEIYDALIILEEEIEDCYMKIVELETQGMNEVEYEYYYQLIHQDVKKELDYYKIIESLGYHNIFEKRVEKELLDTNEFIISLGRHSKAIYYRLKYFMEATSFDANFEYLTTLRTDCNKIMIAMLDVMINNPSFKDIKDELIWFKYNLFYMHLYTERDYLEGKGIGTALDIDSYRTQDYPIFPYLDKAILVLPSIDALDYIIANAVEGFRENKTIFANVTLKLLLIICSMTLCTEENIRSVFFTINDILENPEYSDELRALLQEMINILQKIKSHISYKR